MEGRERTLRWLLAAQLFDFIWACLQINYIYRTMRIAIMVRITTYWQRALGHDGEKRPGRGDLAGPSRAQPLAQPKLDEGICK